MQIQQGKVATIDGKAISSTDVLSTLEDYSDIASWLNDTIDYNDEIDGALAEGHAHGLSELERRVSQLSAAVEVACEDTSAQLEKTIEEVSRKYGLFGRNVPRRCGRGLSDLPV